MNLLARSLPIRIIRRLERHPVAFVSTLALGFKLGRDGWRYQKGEIDSTELRRRVGGHLGTVGGGVAGAAAGAAAGTSVMPGLGTLVGAFAGGMIGETIGGKLGRTAVENAETILKSEPTQGPAPPQEAEAGPPADPGHPKRSL